MGSSGQKVGQTYRALSHLLPWELGANLTGADFSYANLTNANLNSTFFLGAKLTGATMPDGAHSLYLVADLKGATTPDGAIVGYET